MGPQSRGVAARNCTCLESRSSRGIWCAGAESGRVSGRAQDGAQVPKLNPYGQ
jgi:hypothetical protein